MNPMQKTICRITICNLRGKDIVFNFPEDEERWQKYAAENGDGPLEHNQASTG